MESVITALYVLNLTELFCSGIYFIAMEYFVRKGNPDKCPPIIKKRLNFISLFRWLAALVYIIDIWTGDSMPKNAVCPVDFFIWKLSTPNISVLEFVHCCYYYFAFVNVSERTAEGLKPLNGRSSSIDEDSKLINGKSKADKPNKRRQCGLIISCAKGCFYPFGKCLKYVIPAPIRTYLSPPIEKKATIGYALRLYLIFHFSLALFPAISLLKDLISGNNLDNFCQDSISTIGSVLGALFGFASVIVFPVLLWETHDAFFFKREFIIHAVLGFALGIGGFVLDFMLGQHDIGSVLMLLSWLALTTGSLGIPMILGILHQFKTKSITPKKELDTTKKDGDIDPKIPFGKHQDVQSFLKKDGYDDSLGYYMTHNGMVEMSYVLIGWVALVKYSQLESVEQCSGHFYLIFNKFFKPDAYLHVNIYDEDYKNIKEIYDHINKPEEFVLNKVDDDKPSENPKSLVPNQSSFDGVRKYLEEELYNRVFVPYFASEVYSNFKSKNFYLYSEV